MDERVRFLYTAYRRVRLTVKQGGGGVSQVYASVIQVVLRYQV